MAAHLARMFPSQSHHGSAMWIGYKNAEHYEVPAIVESHHGACSLKGRGWNEPQAIGRSPTTGERP